MAGRGADRCYLGNRLVAGRGSFRAQPLCHPQRHRIVGACDPAAIDVGADSRIVGLF